MRSKNVAAKCCTVVHKTRYVFHLDVVRLNHLLVQNLPKSRDILTNPINVKRPPFLFSSSAMVFAQLWNVLRRHPFINSRRLRRYGTYNAYSHSQKYSYANFVYYVCAGLRASQGLIVYLRFFFATCRPETLHDTCARYNHNFLVLVCHYCLFQYTQI